MPSSTKTSRCQFFCTTNGSNKYQLWQGLCHWEVVQGTCLRLGASRDGGSQLLQDRSSKVITTTTITITITKFTITTGWSFATAIFISFWRALKNNEIIQLNHFCQPQIETFWYFEVSLWSGEKKSCLSRLCQNNVMAPYCKGWEPKTHLCASNFQK